MTRTVNNRNQIWYERNDNAVTVGFTKAFLDSMAECWHILPANMNRLREHAPLMVIETNDKLISIKSPITANFVQFNGKAQNFPNQLTEDDVVFELQMGAEQRVGARAQMANVPMAAMAEQDGLPRLPNGQVDWAEANRRVQENARNEVMARRPANRGNGLFGANQAAQFAAVPMPEPDDPAPPDAVPPARLFGRGR